MALLVTCHLILAEAQPVMIDNATKELWRYMLYAHSVCSRDIINCVFGIIQDICRDG